MAYTEPRTWSAETLTSVLLNLHLRDNLRALEESTRAETATAVTITGTTAATATTILTSGAYTYDGTTNVYLEFSFPWLSINENTVANNYCVFSFWDGATELGAAGIVAGQAGGNVVVSGATIRSRRYTPSAASHTFTIRAYKVAGSNPGTVSVQCGAGGTGNYDKMTLRIVGAGS